VEIIMGHAELIRKLESLSSVQREAVEHLVEALAMERRQRDRAQLDNAIAAARGSWPKKMSVEEIDAEVAAMRSEWDGQI
jgi:hypothetical protein